MNGPSCLCDNRWGAGGAHPGAPGRWRETPQFSSKVASESETYRRAWWSGVSEDIPHGKESVTDPRRQKWTGGSWREMLAYQHGPCTLPYSAGAESHTCARGDLANSWHCPVTAELAAANVWRGLVFGQLGLTVRGSQEVSLCFDCRVKSFLNRWFRKSSIQAVGEVCLPGWPLDVWRGDCGGRAQAGHTLYSTQHAAAAIYSLFTFTFDLGLFHVCGLSGSINRS